MLLQLLMLLQTLYKYTNEIAGLGLKIRWRMAMNKCNWSFGADYNHRPILYEPCTSYTWRSDQSLQLLRAVVTFKAFMIFYSNSCGWIFMKSLGGVDKELSIAAWTHVLPGFTTGIQIQMQDHQGTVYCMITSFSFSDYAIRHFPVFVHFLMEVWTVMGVLLVTYCSVLRNLCCVNHRKVFE